MSSTPKLFLKNLIQNNGEFPLFSSLESKSNVRKQPYISKLEKLPISVIFDQFRMMRHMLAWVANSPPDVISGVSILSQVSSTVFEERDVTKINSIINHLHDTEEIKLEQITPDKDTLKMMIYCDGSFSTNDKISSQFGYIILLADKNNRANIMHFSNKKSKLIVRSVLGAETIGLSNAVDMEMRIAHDIH